MTTDRNSWISKDENGVVRLAQISDPHLLADKTARFLGIEPWQSLSAVVAELRQEPELDLILATGDLSQDHTTQAYLNFAEAIAPLDRPTYVLPGNHDAVDLMNIALAATPVHYHPRIEIGAWQILMLDSTILGKPAGHLEISELSWVQQMLKQHAQQPTLIALHHHPKPTGCAWLDQHGLDNGTEFLNLLSRYPQVKAVIWGHVHQEMDLDHHGIRLLSAPATSIQFKPLHSDFTLDQQQPGYRLLYLYPDGSIITRVKRLKGESFMPDPSANGY